MLYALIFYSQNTLAPVQNNFPPSPHSLRPIFVASVSFVAAGIILVTIRVLTLCAYDINAAPVYAGVHDPLFVATNADDSDCMHIALGSLQR